MKIIPIFTLLTFILTSNIHSLVSAETLRPKMLFDSQAESKSAIIDYSDMMCVTDLADDEIKDKVVLVSADLNVGITSEDLRPEAMMRIRAIKEDLSYLLEKGAKKIVIMSHNGDRTNYIPDLKDGEVDKNYSLESIAGILTGLLANVPNFKGKSVFFADDCIGEKTRDLIQNANPGSIILTEQTRFYAAETSKDGAIVEEFARQIQDTVQANVFVNAGAGALHRGKQASKGIVSKYIDGPKVLGILPKKELDVLQQIATNPKRKVIGVFGGAKLEGGKLDAIKTLIENKEVDRLVIVGKMAIPFIQNEPGIAQEIITMAKENKIELIIPEEVVAVQMVVPISENITTSDEFIDFLKRETPPVLKMRTVTTKDTPDLPGDWIILDTDPEDIQQKLRGALKNAITIIYNGTAGLNEIIALSAGTNAIIDILKDFKEKNPDATLIGLGGDGVTAILAHLGQEKADETFTILSTMGGAALEYLSGKPLSAMDSIDNKKVFVPSSVDILAQRVTTTQGAMTGEVYIDDVIEEGANGIIAGHSETRANFQGELNERINRQITAAHERKLKTIILCVGETDKEKIEGKSKDKVRIQLLDGLNGLNPEQAGNTIIAYEPRWAIKGSGYGKPAEPQDAQEMAFFIREFIKERFGEETARKIRILYGGSADKTNARNYLSQADVDGLLVGGQSISVADFKPIIEIAQEIGPTEGRIPYIGGNWKTYQIKGTFDTFVSAFKDMDPEKVQIGIAPSLTKIRALREAEISI